MHDIFGHWTLSKGRVEEEESNDDALKRVIKDEIGLEVTPEEVLGVLRDGDGGLTGMLQWRM